MNPALEMIKTAKWMAENTGLPHVIVLINGQLKIRPGKCPNGATLIERCLP